MQDITQVRQECFYEEGDIKLFISAFVLEENGSYVTELYFMSEVGDYRAVMDQFPDDKDESGKRVTWQHKELATLRASRLVDISLNELTKFPGVITHYMVICREVAKHANEGYSDIRVALATIEKDKEQPNVGNLFSAN